MTATDERLRARARRLAGRLVVDHARRGLPRRPGLGRPRAVRGDVPGAELDLDASLESIVTARHQRRPVAADELRAREWGRADMAACLVVDRSGSMAGERLAGAALAAAACTWRAPNDHAVLVFSDTVIAITSMGRTRPPTRVVEDLLALRGHGRTDLAAALAAARDQLDRSRAARKVCILLSDCDYSAGGDPTAAAALLPELLVVGPLATETATAELCRRAGARYVAADGPTATVGALASLLA